MIAIGTRKRRRRRAGLVLAFVLGFLVRDLLQPSGAQEGGEDEGAVDALAGAITLFDLRLEAIERGCLWMPPAQRDLGVVQVRRKGR